MIKILVDDQELQVEAGITVLEACLASGVFIPHLCHIPELKRPRASCRMCFVEIEGENRPVTSCTVAVREGMRVRTDTPEVRRLQRTGLQLLLSVHDVDCGHCPSNKNCPLQDIAKRLKVGLKPKLLDKILKEPAVVQDHPYLDYYPNRCILCSKCLHACRSEHGQPFLTFAKRGFETLVSFFGESALPLDKCRTRPACVTACPVSALRLRESAGGE